VHLRKTGANRAAMTGNKEGITFANKKEKLSAANPADSPFLLTHQNQKQILRSKHCYGKPRAGLRRWHAHSAANTEMRNAHAG